MRSKCVGSKRLIIEADRIFRVGQKQGFWGRTGILVYTDNGIVGPWLVAHIIIHSTEGLCLLDAIQPGYMHPYLAAKMAADYAFLHRRRIYLNMVAGGFSRNLQALNDQMPHDDRYARVMENTQIMKLLTVICMAHARL